MSVNSASEFFSFSRGYFRSLILNNTVPFQKIGSNVRFEKSVLVKHFENKKNNIGSKNMNIPISKEVSLHIIDNIEQLRVSKDTKPLFDYFDNLVRAKELYKNAEPTKWKFTTLEDDIQALQAHSIKAPLPNIIDTGSIDIQSYIDTIKSGNIRAVNKLTLTLIKEYLSFISKEFSLEKYKTKKNNQIIDFSKTVSAIELLQTKMKRGFLHV